MRWSGMKRTFRMLSAGVFAAVLLLPATALAQLPGITPKTSITPTRDTGGWVYWMAEGAIIIGALIVIAVVLSYLRFSPRFFGREEPARSIPPGARPPLLASRAPVRQAPAQKAAAVPGTAGQAAPAVAGTATAVAERPAAPAPAVAASTATTAPPSGEPAVQADAVGQAETEAPETRPTAKTAEDVGAGRPSEAVATAPAATEPATEPATTSRAAPAPAPQPATTHGTGTEIDQETFDRVLKEQLDKGVDRRVAEGRARAAAVVAARKKAQG